MEFDSEKEKERENQNKSHKTANKMNTMTVNH